MLEKDIFGVWIGGARYVQARFPNLIDSTVTYGQDKNEFEFLETCSSNLVKPNSALKNMAYNTTYWKGAVMRLRYTDWGYQRHTIASVTSNGEFQLAGLSLKDTVVMAGGACPGFYLEHGLGELDAPGEFYFDKQTGTLFLIPMKDHSNMEVNFDIWISIKQPNPPPYSKRFYDWPIHWADLGYALLVTPQSRNVQIEGLEFAWDFGGIRVDAPGVIIENCTFRNLLHTGAKNLADLKSGSKDHRTRVQGCEFRDVEYFGVNSRAKGSWVEVSHSTFENIGLVAGYADMSYGAAGNMFAHHNTFHRMGYSAINPGTGSILEDNQIQSILLALSDGGGIYSDTAVGVEVRRNVIRDVQPNVISSHGKFMTGHGVYADDCSSGY